MEAARVGPKVARCLLAVGRGAHQHGRGRACRDARQQHVQPVRLLCLQCRLILAIHCKLDPSSQVHRPHIQKALDLLDTLSSMARLNNVAEQAGRYSSTLKQMLNGIGGDLATLASSKSGATASSASANATASERQNGDSNGDGSGEARTDAADSRPGALLGALDPSLGGGGAAREGSDPNSRTDVDGGPDRIPPSCFRLWACRLIPAT